MRLSDVEKRNGPGDVADVWRRSAKRLEDILAVRNFPAPASNKRGTNCVTCFAERMRPNSHGAYDGEEKLTRKGAVPFFCARKARDIEEFDTS